MQQCYMYIGVASDTSRKIMYIAIFCGCPEKYIEEKIYMPKYTIEVKMYRGADKSLARPGRKQATETEDFDVHISYL